VADGASRLQGRMETAPSLDPITRQQAVRMRVFWFLAGSVVNYLLIATPFEYLKKHAGLSIESSAALALATSTSFFFCWNYFVNFRTDARKRDALWRYIVAVALMYSLSTLLLSFLSHHDFHMQMNVARFRLNLDVVATQFFLAGIKFPLYHYWAFPVKTTKALGEDPN
jgi:putative flippase GtrA